MHFLAKPLVAFFFILSLAPQNLEAKCSELFEGSFFNYIRQETPPHSTLLERWNLVQINRERYSHYGFFDGWTLVVHFDTASLIIDEGPYLDRGQEANDVLRTSLDRLSQLIDYPLELTKKYKSSVRRNTKQNPYARSVSSLYYSIDVPNDNRLLQVLALFPAN
jgi:hypothetical protein